jgi:hypothetical protein
MMDGGAPLPSAPGNDAALLVNPLLGANAGAETRSDAVLVVYDVGMLPPPRPPPALFESDVL